jgi:hypothetical protein
VDTDHDHDTGEWQSSWCLCLVIGAVFEASPGRGEVVDVLRLADEFGSATGFGAGDACLERGVCVLPVRKV